MAHNNDFDHVAGNGLINRRHLLELGLAGLGAAATGSALAAEATPAIQPWQKTPGPGPSGYGAPSPATAHLQRLAATPNSAAPGTGSSRTPLQHLRGTLTPNSLHFERHHSGVPAIDPAQHQLVIHGLVAQPLVFSYEDLLAYPLHSRVYFLECSGNSGANTAPNPDDGTAASLHGLLSCAEWTGVSLSTLLDQAGVDPAATWVTATGADAASMGRSIPLGKAMDDVLIALYQNGEPIRPEQGYPMRLFVPGWEGNVSVKWLTQIKLTDQPANFRDETSRYTDLLADGRSLQFTFPMGVKSLITSPSGQMVLRRQGVHQITGLAWSGHGAIRQVQVSADGGQSWADARLETVNQGLSLTRFHLPWLWQGGPATLQSRATDARGNVQPGRDSWLAQYGANRYHYNAIQSWAVSAQGEVKNVYA
ncbi:MAG: sulfite dehydrogenase [Pseudomonadales bacterium]|nr:sulfite dehydrogenase [Pseudomonadales bacterium]